MARQGGSYVIQDGEPVLVERTGFKPRKTEPKAKTKPGRKAKGKSDSED